MSVHCSDWSARLHSQTPILAAAEARSKIFRLCASAFACSRMSDACASDAALRCAMRAASCVRLAEASDIDKSYFRSWCGLPRAQALFSLSRDDTARLLDELPSIGANSRHPGGQVRRADFSRAPGPFIDVMRPCNRCAIALLVPRT